MKIKFSIPLWPGLSQAELEQVIPILVDCRNSIHDIYATSRIAPFNSDAMGGVFISGEERTALSNALVVTKEVGVPLSATFNNVHVSPSFDNYSLFIKNFTHLYEAGIKTTTIPHTSWLSFGLKDTFPGLVVKNTILNKVYSASEVFKLFEAGFDYINLDRTLMRDEDGLREIYEAKRVAEKLFRRPLFVSLLYNEKCIAHCPMQQEHFTYNMYRAEGVAPFFNSPSGKVASCTVSDPDSAEYLLKSAAIPSYYSLLDNLSKHVDVFKLHGRESRTVFYESLNTLESIHHRRLTEDYIRPILSKVAPKMRAAYLTKIRTCKFNCWKCNLCAEVANSLSE